MVKWDRSGLDSLITWEFNQIKLMVYFFLGSLNMLHIRSVATSSDGRTSYEKVFNKPKKSPIVHFGACSRSCSVSTPAQKLQIRASLQKSQALWLDKDVITGMHIVGLTDGQMLKERTVTLGQRGATQHPRVQVVQSCSSWIIYWRSGPSYDNFFFWNWLNRFCFSKKTWSSMNYQTWSLKLSSEWPSSSKKRGQCVDESTSIPKAWHWDGISTCSPSNGINSDAASEFCVCVTWTPGSFLKDLLRPKECSKHEPRRSTWHPAHSTTLGNTTKNTFSWQNGS